MAAFRHSWTVCVQPFDLPNLHSFTAKWSENREIGQCRSDQTCHAGRHDWHAKPIGRHFREYEMPTAKPFFSQPTVFQNHTGSPALIPPGAMTPSGFAPSRLGVRRLNAGWLIARRTNSGVCGQESVICLQLGTGQWCPPDQATWFPERSAAASYASDLDNRVRRSIEIVFLRRAFN